MENMTAPDLKSTSFMILSPKHPQEEKLPINLDLNCEFPIDLNKKLLQSNQRFDQISKTLQKL